MSAIRTEESNKASSEDFGNAQEGNHRANFLITFTVSVMDPPTPRMSNSIASGVKI